MDVPEQRRVLIVANQTACGDELLEAVRARMLAGACRFTLLVPATPPHEHATWTEGEARAVARRRMDEALGRLRAVDAQVDGVVGDASPVQAIDDLLLDRPQDEILLSTLPPGISRWLRRALPERVAQRFGLPVTTIVSGRHPVA